MLRRNKTGRATGVDPFTFDLYHHHAAELALHSYPLLLKVWLWGEEPVQFKGGPMALLPKRPCPSTVQHFRGILLLPTVAKGFHALLRQKVIQILGPQRLPGQLGGFPQQEVLYGSHAFRLLGRAATSRGFSLGVLFVDLSTAFHSLIRDLNCSERLQFVIDSLRSGGHSAEALQLGSEIPGLGREMNAPAYLVRLFQNIHSATWMTVGAHGFLQTNKGTRPGSPLADATFHFIMYDVSKSLRDFLEQAGHLAFVRNHLQMYIDMIIWSDDLAVPAVTARSTELVPAMLGLLDFIRAQFTQRGFQLNLSKGKTGIVATFYGTDAPSMRKEF